MLHYYHFTNKRIGLYTENFTVTYKAYLLLPSKKEVKRQLERNSPESVLVSIYPPPTPRDRDKDEGTRCWFVADPSITQSVHKDNPFDIFKPFFESLIVIVWLISIQSKVMFVVKIVEVNQQSCHLNICYKTAVEWASLSWVTLYMILDASPQMLGHSLYVTKNDKGFRAGNIVNHTVHSHLWFQAAMVGDDNIIAGRKGNA